MGLRVVSVAGIAKPRVRTAPKEEQTHPLPRRYHPTPKEEKRVPQSDSQLWAEILKILQSGDL